MANPLRSDVEHLGVMVAALKAMPRNERWAAILYLCARFCVTDGSYSKDGQFACYGLKDDETPKEASRG